MKISLDKALSFMYNRSMDGTKKALPMSIKYPGQSDFLPKGFCCSVQNAPDFIPFQNLDEEFLLAIELDDYRDFKQAANYVTEPVLDNVSTAITDSKTRKHTRGSNAIIGSESK